ncbi:MAG: M48 family metallopeptidase [Roseibium sp.]|nr:M48 family metallopeptidase [Roseibium sp.]
MRPFRQQIPLPGHVDLETGTRSIRIRLRSDTRARRYLLRIPAGTSEPVLTVPPSGDLARAERFARQHVHWLVDRLESRPERIPFAPSSTIPLRGADHLVIAAGGLRGLVSAVRDDSDNPSIFVPGAPEHLPRKLLTFLKAEARADLTSACSRHAAKIGKRITGISVRDTKSRWGSCAANGRLSFSWRLILAPPEILDYVAAHEVAHLAEMNHSDRFWTVCERLAPHTPSARKWLKDNGHRLHAYG